MTNLRISISRKPLALKAAFALFVISASAEAQRFLCFEAPGKKAPIQLQFDLPAEGQELTSVTYRKGNGTIQLRKVSEKEVDDGPDGRPSLIRTVWEEIVPTGKKGGRYEMDAQGAVVYSFQYKRPDGKKFDFTAVDDAEGAEGCEWK
ncbi:MAG TPA: hypothetical protein PK208_06110 [Fibrobacteria bacterium]|nr:hypothetical protein [Fibrobacteria bacterium]